MMFKGYCSVLPMLGDGAVSIDGGVCPAGPVPLLY